MLVRLSMADAIIWHTGDIDINCHRCAELESLSPYLILVVVVVLVFVFVLVVLTMAVGQFGEYGGVVRGPEP